MPPALLILPGQVFGRCTVINPHLFLRYNGTRYRVCLVRCVCGTEFQATLKNLLSGNTSSCGCFKREGMVARNYRHGGRESTLYNTWSGMRRRCRNPHDSHYSSYGGRGISVCEAWEISFETFRDWAMAAGYQPGLSIERRDVNGPYTPENCCFIPLAAQGANKRKTVRVTWCGETKTLREWSCDPRCRVGYTTLKYRIAVGWPPEHALTLPTPSRFFLTQRQGEACSYAKLSTAAVLAIRAAYTHGETMSHLARAYNVCRTTISHIIHRRSWFHI